MKRKRIVAWSPLNTWLAAAVLCIAAMGFVIGMEPTSARLTLILVVMVALICALAVDEYAGLVIAVITAACAVVIKQNFGDWQSTSFVHASALAVSIVMAVWSISIVATRLRRTRRPRVVSEEPAADAKAVIAVEWERATVHHRPLTLLAIRMSPVPASSNDDPDALERAEQEVSRMLSAIAAPTDIPVALAHDQIGVLLVEKTDDDALATVADLTGVLTRATVTLGDGARRRAVSDFLDIGFGIARADQDTDADAFLTRATAAAAAPLATGEPT